MNVRPAKADMKVPMPERGGLFLPATGQVVPDTPYWFRRVRDGSVIRTDVPTADRPRARQARESAKE